MAVRVRELTGCIARAPSCASKACGVSMDGTGRNHVREQTCTRRRSRLRWFDCNDGRLASFGMQHKGRRGTYLDGGRMNEEEGAEVSSVCTNPGSGGSY